MRGDGERECGENHNEWWHIAVKQPVHAMAGEGNYSKATVFDFARCLIISLTFLWFFAFLSDAPSVTPASAFEHAEQMFFHGYLEDAQNEAAQGYAQFLFFQPSWARQFQLLEATAMTWRGLNNDVIGSLADDRIPWTDPQDNIQRLQLRAVALTHMHRFSEAEHALVEADKLCVSGDSVQCGSALQAHGLLLFERGQTQPAKKAFSKSLEFARLRNDGMLEATTLQNLGRIASQEEHHDEALAYYQLSANKATELGAADLQQRVLGNQGWEQYTLGNPDKALEVFRDVQQRASLLGDIGYEIQWLETAADVYADLGQLALAEQSDLRAIDLAHQFSRKQSIIDASEDLAQTYTYDARPDDAVRYAGEALALAQQTGSKPDILYCHMLQGEAAALRHDWPRAEALLQEVVQAPESQRRMRWTAEHTLATSYEAQGQMAAAEQAYKSAIAIVEAARADLHQELSQLTFLNNATRIYDDYIHFLVTQGRTDEALEAADWSRARTLQQGLGLVSANAAMKPPALRASQIARSTNSTLLFYWMGERQSYVWAATPEKTTLAILPAKSEIVARMQRYRRTLLALKDPLRANGGQGDTDGRDLYEMLVAPVAGLISPTRPAVLFTDGEMTQLNFETLLAGAGTPHYWIEDATVSSAPSIRLFATASRKAGSRMAGTRSGSAVEDRLLLMGDSVSADAAFPALPMAALEVNKVRNNFNIPSEVVFSGAQATPRSYIASRPEQFSYIHFVAHATASNTDPLESAVILSRDDSGDDSYKLYASEILKHPISARLVTISACNSSGNQFYAGEGVVGLSWAFLRAGAHNTIGALWEVSDASTPDLMDHLYGGLERNQSPATALRNAKLSLLHSNSNFSRPFYWAAFQLYSGH